MKADTNLPDIQLVKVLLEGLGKRIDFFFDNLSLLRIPSQLLCLRHAKDIFLRHSNNLNMSKVIPEMYLMFQYLLDLQIQAHTSITLQQKLCQEFITSNGSVKKAQEKWKHELFQGLTFIKQKNFALQELEREITVVLQDSLAQNKNNIDHFTKQIPDLLHATVMDKNQAKVFSMKEAIETKLSEQVFTFAQIENKKITNLFNKLTIKAGDCIDRQIPPPKKKMHELSICFDAIQEESKTDTVFEALRSSHRDRMAMGIFGLGAEMYSNLRSAYKMSDRLRKSFLDKNTTKITQNIHQTLMKYHQHLQISVEIFCIYIKNYTDTTVQFKKGICAFLTCKKFVKQGNPLEWHIKNINDPKIAHAQKEFIKSLQQENLILGELYQQACQSLFFVS